MLNSIFALYFIMWPELVMIFSAGFRFVTDFYSRSVVSRDEKHVAQMT